MSPEPDMAEVVRHTEEYAEDRDKNFGAAALEMAEHLEGVTGSDIIQAR